VKTHFVFELLACAALLCGTAYADQGASNKRPEQTGHAARKPQRSRLGTPQLMKRPRAPFQNAPHVSGHRLPKHAAPLAAATTRGLASVREQPALNTEPHFRDGALDNVRHRSPNPAVIGGSAEPGKMNTAAIDGSQVHRRP